MRKNLHLSSGPVRGIALSAVLCLNLFLAACSGSASAPQAESTGAASGRSFAAPAAESSAAESGAADKAAESGAAETAAETAADKAAESSPAVQPAERGAAGEPEGKDGSAGTETGSAAEASGMSGDTGYYGPKPGEAEPAIEGGYASGRVVVFDKAAYLRQPDGIYLLADHREPELLVPLDTAENSEICTDGYMLYYCDGRGHVMSLDLTAKELKPVQVSSKDFEVPAGSGVVGAGHYSVYVETAGFTEDMYEGPGDFSDVIVMDLKTGKPETAYEGYYGGCRGGYTYIRHDSFDVSAQPMKIFGFQGEVAAEEPWCWNIQPVQGLLWYSVTEEESGFTNSVLYRLDVDGPEEMHRCEGEDGTYYGITVNGFLAAEAFEPAIEADYGGFMFRYLDLRTMKPLDEKLAVPGEEVTYWNNGFTVRGKDYLMDSNRIFRVDEDGLTDIFDIPADIFCGGIYLTDNHILVEDVEDRVCIFDLDEDVSVHPIRVTALTQTKRETGTEGLMVRENHTAFMTEGAWYWGSLANALDAWNADAAERAAALAEECYTMAEDLAEMGLYEDHEDPALTADIKAYIQRADTQAFTFMEHESTNLIAAPRNYEVKTGYNFSTEDGHALTLDEVFKDLNGLSELLINNILKEFPRLNEVFSPYDFVDEMLSRRVLSSTPEFSWVLGYEGVTFYFNGMKNFPYVRGAWKVYVSFSEHPELFEEKWLKVPDSYSYDILLDDYFSEDYQVESEKGIETVLVTLDKAIDADGNTENYVDTMNIWVSGAPMGEMRTNEDMAMSISSDTVSGMILHLGNAAGGRNFLLAQYNGDSMGLEVFALDGTPSRACEIGQGALPQYCPENGVDAAGGFVTHAWLSDPDFFTVLTPDKDDFMNGFTERNFCRLVDGKILPVSGQKLP